jgi:tRNA dimethylallyltransferase
MTGKTYTSFRVHKVKQRPFNIVKIGLNRDRSELYERINNRVLKMMDDGLEEECRKMYPFRGINSLNTVGYKELFSYFDGNIDKQEAIRQIQSNTRQYMRKQITWFKHDEKIKWFSPDNIKEIINYIDCCI